MPSISQIYNGALLKEARQWKDIKSGFTHFAENDIALAKITPCFQNSKAAIMRGLHNGFGAGTTELHVFRPINNTILSEYVYLYLKSPKFIQDGILKMTGSAGQKRVPVYYFAGTPFPLPPLEEQIRIVAKVDELMALCDKLEAQQQQQANNVLRANTAAINALLNPEPQQTAKSQKISATVSASEPKASFEQNWQRIAQHFNTLYGCTLPMPKGEGRKKKHLVGLGNVKALKGLIKTLACQGKLTHQDLKNNAEVLINLADSHRLNLSQRSEGQLLKELGVINRKLKKQRAIKPSEILPQNWKWVSLIEISQLIVDCHNKTAPYTEHGIHLIRTTNIRDGLMDVNSSKKVSEETYQYWSRRCFPKVRDIFFTREAPMGEAAMVPEGEKVGLGQRTMLIRLFEDCLLPEYLLIAIYDSNFQFRMEHLSLGATVKHLRVGDVENLFIPLPPLEEQKRIVAKVDQLMLLCDQLEQQLTQSYSDAEKLMQATVKALVA